MANQKKKTAKKQDLWTTIVEPQLSYIQGLRRRGLTLEETSRELGISSSTLYRLQEMHPALKLALKDGAEESNIAVENALFSSAVGTATETTYTERSAIDENGNLAVISVEKKTIQKAPNVSAISSYLLNRVYKRWKPVSLLAQQADNDDQLEQVCNALLAAVKSKVEDNDDGSNN